MRVELFYRLWNLNHVETILKRKVTNCPFRLKNKYFKGKTINEHTNLMFIKKNSSPVVTKLLQKLFLL